MLPHIVRLRIGRRPSFRTFSLPILLRALGVATGFISALIFYALASDQLGQTDFAELVIAMNCAVVVQAFDLGVGARFITTMARARGGSAKEFRFLPFAVLNAIVAASSGIVALFIFIVLIGVAGELTFASASTGAITLAGSVFAGAASCYLGALIAATKTLTYYSLALLQPLTLGFLTLVIFSTGSTDQAHFALAFSVSLITPVVGAAFVSARYSLLSYSGRPKVTEVQEIARGSLPLGGSQVAGTVLYTGFPSVIALTGSLTVVAQYAFMLRVYMAMWSLVSTIHASNWAQVAQAHDAAAPEQRQMRAKLNSLGAVVGLVGALAMGLSYPILSALGQRDLAPSLPVASLLGIALLARAWFIGELLALSVMGPHWGLIATQWVVAGLLVTLMLTIGGSVALIPALLLLAASLMDGSAMRLSNNWRTGRSA